MTRAPAELAPAPARAEAAPIPLRFNLQELSGSLGDLGTFIPLALAMAVACHLDLGLIFIFAGLMHMLSGWAFRQPIPVQPMKAIAAVAITEQLLPTEIAAAGSLMGALMIALAFAGVVTRAAHHVPRAVVRGIQVGVGIKLALTGVAWLFGESSAVTLLGLDSLLIAAVVAALLIHPRLARTPILLIVFLAGLVLAFLAQPNLLQNLTPHWPEPALLLPSLDAWQTGLLRGALPQLPLTLLNSVVAVCALSADYFPGRGIAPRRMAVSVGLMNLLTVPFGGMPLCHGAGGLAAHHRFGARTGGSVIMLGLIKIAAGLALGSALLGLVQAYPRSILAVMLILAGIALAKPVRATGSPPIRSAGSVGYPVDYRALFILTITAAGILLTNTAVGAVLGLALALVFHLIDERRLRNSRTET